MLVLARHAPREGVEPLPETIRRYLRDMRA
jgi:hypothetical protein